MTKKENPTEKYFNEELDYGGIPTRRIDIYNDLKSQGATDRQIEYYFIGAEHKQFRDS